MAAAIVCLVLVAGTLAGGMMLPGARAVTHTVEIEAPPETTYRFLSDLRAGWRHWSPLVPDAEGIAVDYGVETAGIGASVSWRGKAGAGSLRLTDCVPPRRLAYESRLDLGGMFAQGSFDLKPAPAGTVVTWQDELTVGKNPLLRWLAFALDGMRQRQLAQGLAALKRVSEGELQACS